MLKAMDNAGVQLSACWALGSLAHNNAANQVKIAALGGIQAILDSGCSKFGLPSTCSRRKEEETQGEGVGGVGGSASGVPSTCQLWIRRDITDSRGGNSARFIKSTPGRGL
jgi:hypothetical protein